MISSIPINYLPKATAEFCEKEEVEDKEETGPSAVAIPSIVATPLSSAGTSPSSIRRLRRRKRRCACEGHGNSSLAGGSPSR